jgi:hypothetical protein
MGVFKHPNHKYVINLKNCKQSFFEFIKKSNNHFQMEDDNICEEPFKKN